MLTSTFLPISVSFSVCVCVLESQQFQYQLYCWHSLLSCFCSGLIRSPFHSAFVSIDSSSQFRFYFTNNLGGLAQLSSCPARITSEQQTQLESTAENSFILPDLLSASHRILLPISMYTCTHACVCMRNWIRYLLVCVSVQSMYATGLNFSVGV